MHWEGTLIPESDYASRLILESIVLAWSDGSKDTEKSANLGYILEAVGCF